MSDDTETEKNAVSSEDHEKALEIRGYFDKVEGFDKLAGSAPDGRAVYAVYSIKGTPYALFLNKHGKVRWRLKGGVAEEATPDNSSNNTSKGFLSFEEVFDKIERSYREKLAYHFDILLNKS